MDALFGNQFSSVFGLLVKLATLIGITLYALFAGIVVRQEHLMDKAIDETFEPVLKVFVFVHFALSVGLLLLAVIIL